MEIIEGFPAAKFELSRQTPTEFYPISPNLKKRLKDMFGTEDPEQAVRQIIDAVRVKGDAALLDYTLRIDGIKLTSLEISKAQIAAAYREVDKKLVAALKLAAERIRIFHIRQRDDIWSRGNREGLGQMVRPLERVGVYVPGGTAAYPSTVLMTAVPARVAGVREIILVSPPKPPGSLLPITLVAADIAKVDRVFCVGGAQAIGALAYGTRTIPNVDKICGPGNIFVVLAKKLVYGVVGIDALQGPSEVLIIADDTANPALCAADMLAQAEHDPLASAILVTTSSRLAEEVDRELEQQVHKLERETIAAEALEHRGKIAVVTNINEAIELANLYAPEHLSLAVANAASYLDRIVNAGCVFVGQNSPVVLGDYVAGPSHVLPTGGTARFSSPLNVGDFLKLINVAAIDAADFKELGQAASIIARAEGLEAHAKAIEKRLGES